MAGNKQNNLMTRSRSNGSSFEESYELPNSYGVTRVTLITRDPHWVHAYWEISASAFDEARQKLGYDCNSAAVVLRLYDVTYRDFNGTNANHWFDIDVGRDTRMWYINLWNDNAVYCAEIGLRTQSGWFLPVARSNFIETQRSGMAGRNDMIWMDPARGKAGHPHAIAETFSTENKSPTSFVVDEKQGLEVKATKAKRRQYSLTADDIRAYYGKMLPILRRLRSKKRLSSVGTTKKPVILSDFERLLIQRSVVGDVTDSPFYKRLFFGGSSADFVAQREGSEQLLSTTGASEQSQPQQAGKPFFFELNTELIVYGRTEPDATVYMGGKQIPLRSDGTFSLRFALPDATDIPLDFTAVSNDNAAQRRIVTGVARRKTLYTP